MLKKGHLVFSAIIFFVLLACGLALAADVQPGMDMDIPGCACMNAPSAGMGYGCGTNGTSCGAGCGMMGPGQPGPGQTGCGCAMMGGRMSMGMGGRMGRMRMMGGMKMMRERAQIMSAMGITAGPAIMPFASPLAKEILQDPEVKQFLDQTKKLRMELVRKRFDYYEALRDPATKPQEIINMRKELRRLQKEILDKAPFVGPRGCYGPADMMGTGPFDDGE